MTQLEKNELRSSCLWRVVTGREQGVLTVQHQCRACGTARGLTRLPLRSVAPRRTYFDRKIVDVLVGLRRKGCGRQGESKVASVQPKQLSHRLPVAVAINAVRATFRCSSPNDRRAVVCDASALGLGLWRW